MSVYKGRASIEKNNMQAEGQDGESEKTCEYYWYGEKGKVVNIGCCHNLRVISFHSVLFGLPGR